VRASHNTRGAPPLDKSGLSMLPLSSPGTSYRGTPRSPERTALAWLGPSVSP